MSDLNLQLYGFLMDHIDQITDEWLSMRELKDGSVYSSDAGEDATANLRNQNQLTNLTVASSLLEDKTQFQNSKDKWAQIVAEDRTGTSTPLPEVLAAVSKAREAYWVYVGKFVKDNKEQVGIDDMLHWGNTLNAAFDTLCVAFSEAYDAIMVQRLTAQTSLIEELSSPVIKMTSHMGVLPLIGDIDTVRAKKILDYVPERCTQINIELLFIDLSGVSIIDTMVAHQIYQVTQMLSLLGVQSTITGIRPEIAQTAIQLGLDFSQIPTYSSLEQALKDSAAVFAG